MLKDRVLFPKRSTTFAEDNQTLEINFRPRKIPLRPINEENSQKLVSRNARNQENWNKKEEEDLMVYFMQKIIDQPYLSFTWNIFKEERNLTKISRKINIPLKSCQRKINQIESVHEQKYSVLKVIDFMIVYWKGQGFTSKTGWELIKKIRELKNTKSEHMRMMEEKMERTRAEQPAFDKLYELFMRS